MTVDLRIERVTQELSIQDSFGSGQDASFVGPVSHVVVVAPEGYRGVRFVVRHDAARPSEARWFAESGTLQVSMLVQNLEFLRTHPALLTPFDRFELGPLSEVDLGGD